MILEEEIEQFFIWFPNTHLTSISFVTLLSLWIIDEFENI